MSTFNSLLSQLRSFITIDVDSMDPSVTIRHSTPSEPLHDMTSNQAIVYNESIRAENATLVKEAIKYVQFQGLDQNADLFPQNVVDVVTILLAKEVYPFIRGNVHAQTSPSTAYNTEKTIEHAKKLVALFGEFGIPKQRVCIKIPATPESILACHYLSKLGIQTLATCIFSTPQAAAASQAGCIYVAPYFNELRVHFDPAIWKEYDDTVQGHPMSLEILAIIQLLKIVRSTTRVMPASIVTVNEVLALASLKPDHLTLSGLLLDQLAALPEVTPAAFHLSKSVPTPDISGNDYLANGGALLKEALLSDSETSRKLIDALSIFDEREKMTRDFVKTYM